MSLLKSKPVDFETLWSEIEPSVEVLVNGTHRPFSYEKWQGVYRGVYSICTNPGAPQAEALFFQLREILVRRVTEIVEILQGESGDAEFLELYCNHFNIYSTGSNYVSELFAYLNRYWIRYAHSEYGQAPIPGVYPVPELALRIWRDIVHTTMQHRVVNALLHIFHTSRESGSEFFEYGDLVTTTVQIYLVLGLNKQDPLKLYRNEVETIFLQDTASYYSLVAQNLLQNVSIAEYLNLVEKLCTQEEHRCEGKMHRITVKQVRQTCCRVLVEEHTEQICDEMNSFLENNQVDDLRRLFHLFSELPNDQALMSLKANLKKYIEKSGMEVVQKFQHDESLKNPQEYIEALVAVREKFVDLIREAFGFHALMRTALDQACRTFANSHPRLPELLAKCTHLLMTKQGPNDNEIEVKIDQIGVVFCLLDDKDIFKKYYAKLLSQRLIHGTSVANDFEVLLVQKLREVCGCDFVSKLQKMFSDKLVSQTISSSYRAWRDEHHGMDEPNYLVDFSFDVLTAGVWPIPTSFSNDNVKLPTVCQYQVDLFTTYYVNQSTGRRLHWVHRLSHGLLRMTLSSRLYEVHASMYQIVLLLQFNDQTSWSATQLHERTQIPNIEAVHYHLQPLVKIKLLHAAPDLTMYTLNDKFTLKRSRIKAIPVQSILDFQPPVAGTTSSPREVTEDRKMVLQAAIVRVMKSRRECSFNQLFTETTSILSNQFVPSHSFLQQNIDLLIEKEYMRIQSDQMYMYVA
ncbi:Cullin family protein [Thraustotheca clavata]|uniref:Cullin-5 n=1 Tax=Thraustotheca clavata TaxID=74557 RepID=A0A1V9ZWZ8_9STRA|nr:Cullin family protein [Thraustotheca clavata]